MDRLLKRWLRYLGNLSNLYRVRADGSDLTMLARFDPGTMSDPSSAASPPRHGRRMELGWRCPPRTPADLHLRGRSPPLLSMRLGARWAHEIRPHRGWRVRRGLKTGPCWPFSRSPALVIRESRSICPAPPGRGPFCSRDRCQGWCSCDEGQRPPCASRSATERRSPGGHRGYQDAERAREARAGGLLLAAGLVLACTDTPDSAADLHRGWHGLGPGGDGAGAPQQRRRRSPGLRQRPGHLCDAAGQWRRLQRHGVRSAVGSRPDLRRHRRQRDDGQCERHERRHRLRDQSLHRGWHGLGPGGFGAGAPQQRRRRSRVSANGPVIFATPLSSGAAYSVTVLAQPTTPAQTCVVTGGSGTMASANVTTVAIACVTNAGTGAVRVTASTTGPDAPATDTVGVDWQSAPVLDRGRSRQRRRLVRPGSRRPHGESHRGTELHRHQSESRHGDCGLRCNHRYRFWRDLRGQRDPSGDGGDHRPRRPRDLHGRSWIQPLLVPYSAIVPANGTVSFAVASGDHTVLSLVRKRIAPYQFGRACR